MEISWNSDVYSNVVTNPTLAKLYDANATSLGAEFERDPAKIAQPSGSTDMGNVSHVVPSMHPFFSVGSDTATHSREFTTVAGKRGNTWNIIHRVNSGHVICLHQHCYTISQLLTTQHITMSKRVFS